MNKTLMIVFIGCMLLLTGCTEGKGRQVGDTTVVVVDGETPDSISDTSGVDKDKADASTTEGIQTGEEDQPDDSLIEQKDDSAASDGTPSKNTESSTDEEEKKALLDDVLKEIENLKE